MEYLSSNVLTHFVDGDDDGYNSDDLYEASLHSTDLSSLPSPPWSPCDSEFDDCSESLWQCTSVIHKLTHDQPTESAVMCKCCICAQPSGPLIKDCMWSTGIAPPASLSGNEQVSDTVDAESVNVIDFETISSFMKPECVKDSTSSKSEQLDDRVECARLAEYRQLISNSNPVKSPKLGYSMSSNFKYWSSDELNCMSHSDDSSDEVDVVSVFAQKPILVLPALASASEQVAAIHSYSSPYAFRSPMLTTKPLSSSVITVSVQSQKYSAARKCSSSAASFTLKRSLSQRRHRIEKSRMINSCLTNSDTDDSAESSLEDVQTRCIRHKNSGGKRSLHNVLERRRRSCLKLNFHSLRDVVPSVAGNGRVSKVGILKSAHTHMLYLMKEGRELQNELNHLRSLNYRWQCKLGLLTKDDLVQWYRNVDYSL